MRCKDIGAVGHQGALLAWESRPRGARLAAVTSPDRLCLLTLEGCLEEVRPPDPPGGRGKLGPESGGP